MSGKERSSRLPTTLKGPSAPIPSWSGRGSRPAGGGVRRTGDDQGTNLFFCGRAATGRGRDHGFVIGSRSLSVAGVEALAEGVEDAVDELSRFLAAVALGDLDRLVDDDDAGGGRLVQELENRQPQDRP